MHYWLRLLLLILSFKLANSFGQINHEIKTTTSTTTDSFANKPLLIAEIKIVGNKRTKQYIILRELMFKSGDIIAQEKLENILEISKNQVFNTALFLETKISYQSLPGNIINITVSVKERWYFFPLPYFKLVDRNFNQWWVDENRSLDRVNYGIKFTQYNLTGNNDGMDIWLINGYNQQVSLRYNLPFFEKTLKHGVNVGYNYSSQKELNYATAYHKQLFIRTPEYIRKFSRADLTYTFRPDQRWKHSLRTSFTQESVADTIIKVNPNYFPEKRTDIQYLDLSYSVRYQNHDYLAYPTKGVSFEGAIYHRGFDELTNLWQLSAAALYIKPVWTNAFIKINAVATIKLPKTNVYVNQRLLGYSDFFLRGLEYYVIDGDAAALAKMSLHQRLFKYNFNTHLKSKNYKTIPLQYYLKVFGDAGYAQNNFTSIGFWGNNTLSNQLIYTGGIGLDIVSIYDLVFRIELSFNQLGGKGLFLHSK